MRGLEWVEEEVAACVFVFFVMLDASLVLQQQLLLSCRCVQRILAVQTVILAF